MATRKQTQAARSNIKKAQSAARKKRTIAQLPEIDPTRAGQAGRPWPDQARPGRTEPRGPQPHAALRDRQAQGHPGPLPDGEVGPDPGDPQGELMSGQRAASQARNSARSPSPPRGGGFESSHELRFFAFSSTTHS